MALFNSTPTTWGQPIRRSSLWTLIIVVLIWRCTQEPSDVLLTVTSKPGLVIIGIDQTTSMQDTKMADTAFVRQVCLRYASSEQPITIAFGAIGNPTRMTFVRLNLFSMVNAKGQSMSRRAVTEQNNRKSFKANCILIDQYIKLCQQHIKETILTNAHSDIQGFLDKSLVLSKEPVYHNMPVLIFIQSDGAQYLGRLGKNTLLWPEWTQQTSLHLCNWQQQFLPSFPVQQYASPEGFINYIKK
jgi:hypothetical protein